MINFFDELPPTFWKECRLRTPLVHIFCGIVSKLVLRVKNRAKTSQDRVANTSISVADISLFIYLFFHCSFSDWLSISLSVCFLPACRVTPRDHSLWVPPYPPSLTGSVSLRCGRLTSTLWPTLGTRTAELLSERMSSPSTTRQSGEGRRPSNYGWGGSRGWIEAGLDLDWQKQRGS